MPDKKRDSIRSKGRKPKEVDLRGFTDVSVPDPPDGVRESILEWWGSYFRSDVARVTYMESDLPALRRLATLYELRQVAFEIGSADPIVRGGNNQAMEHPLLKSIARYDSAIDRLEVRFGLTPRARLNLGLQVGAATKQLEDLAASGRVAGPDPRDVVDV